MMRHFCYKLFTDAKNFDDSQKDCQDQPKNNGLKGKKGELMSIVDEFEYNMARYLVHSLKKYIHPSCLFLDFFFYFLPFLSIFLMSSLF